MALGRDDVQAVERDDLVVLRVALRLEVLEDALVVAPSARGRTRRGGRSRRTARPRRTALRPSAAARRSASARHCWRAMNSGLPPSRMSVPRPAMLVAIVTDALAAGLRDELRFLRVVLRVQHDVLVGAAAGRRAALQAAPVEHRRQLLGLLDRDRADQHRPALGVLVDDLGDDRVPLFLLGPVDEIGVLDAAQRPVRRDDDDVELVDLGELFGLGVGRAGHAGRASCTCGSSSGR